jgi:peroxiredoxin Q/BCP
MDMLGKQAPDFSLDATTGHQVSLGDLRGVFVVVIFYPANDTPVCNSQLEEASVSSAQLLQHNARVFGVNTAKIEKSRDYCTRKRLEFPILADPGGVVARKYNAFWGLLSMNRRTVVVIDPNGKIIMFERGKPSGEKIINTIKEHQATEQTA